MGFLGGGSGSASNTLSNVINFSPAIQTGEDLTSDITSALDQRASSEATAKDQQSASAGFAAAGGMASGGMAALTDGVQAPKDNVFSGGGGAIDALMKDNTLLYVAAGTGLLLSVYVLAKKKRK